MSKSFTYAGITGQIRATVDLEFLPMAAIPDPVDGTTATPRRMAIKDLNARLTAVARQLVYALEQETLEELEKRVYP